jgi:GT2 family glycosyltransferase
MVMFSIIIPVKSINDYVRETVPHIQRLAGPEWELMVIPNEVELNEWSADCRVRVFPSGRVGPAAKRDMGAAQACGEVLVFLDDDSYPEPNLLVVATRYFSDPEVVALGGPGITPPSDTFWQKVSGAVFLSRFTGGAPERYVPVGTARQMDDWPSVNLLVRRETFLAVGGFDCKYWPGEDTKLCLKLKQTGKKLIYVPEMAVWHHRRAGLRAHLKQVGAYGLHRGYFARHYPETSFRLKYFVPTAFAFFVLLSLAAFWISTPHAELLTFGWGLYGIALLAGLLGIMKYERPPVAFASLVYVPITHFYYGVQFIRGFFKQDELVSRLR